MWLCCSTIFLSFCPILSQKVACQNLIVDFLSNILQPPFTSVRIKYVWHASSTQDAAEVTLVPAKLLVTNSKNTMGHTAAEDERYRWDIFSLLFHRNTGIK